MCFICRKQENSRTGDIQNHTDAYTKMETKIDRVQGRKGEREKERKSQTEVHKKCTYWHYNLCVNVFIWNTSRKNTIMNVQLWCFCWFQHNWYDFENNITRKKYAHLHVHVFTFSFLAFSPPIQWKVLFIIFFFHGIYFATAERERETEFSYEWWMTTVRGGGAEYFHVWQTIDLFKCLGPSNSHLNP